MHSSFDGNHADPLFWGIDVQARWGHLQCRVVCTNVLLEILSGRWQRLVLTGHTSQQIFEWLRCGGRESIAQPRHLAIAATQSGAFFLVLKAECIAVCAPMWHGTQWVYHQPFHLIRSVQGLLPSSPSVSPSPGCLSLVSMLGCPDSTPGRSISFPDCLLFSRLCCPGSMLGKGIPFPDCLLLFCRLGCLGNMHGRGIPFPNCLLLFSKRGYLGSTHGRGISFPHCLLLSNSMGCPSSTPGRGIPFPDCRLLFNPLHYTQSPRTMTHLSHTHYVCEAPPDNPLLLLLLASCIATTHINSFSLSFLPYFFPYCIATTNNINS